MYRTSMIIEKSTIPYYIPLYEHSHVAFGQIPQGKETIDQLFDSLISEHRFGTVWVLPIISIADCPEYGRCWHDAIASVAVEVLGASTRVGHRSVHRHSDT